MADIIVERDGDVLILTLNRPERLNALSDSMRSGLLQELSAEMTAQSARAILLTGNGRGFCSGADLEPETIFARRPLIERHIQMGINQVIKTMRDLPVPVIAAVNGPAAGAGFSLALAADIMLVARSAKFHLSFVKIGAVLDGGASSMLVHKIGAARTSALALLGGSIDAQTAEQWGLAFKIVDDDHLAEEALALARRLAEGPPLALGLIKHEISFAQNATLDDVLRHEAAAQGRAFASNDFEEGVQAFLEKRKPKFKGV